jgi:hypothetical protein
MNWLMLVAMLLAFGVTAYSCASKCVTVPPPGGYSYGQGTERGEQRNTR